jgi:hypothetical protein
MTKKRVQYVVYYKVQDNWIKYDPAFDFLASAKLTAEKKFNQGGYDWAIVKQTREIEVGVGTGLGVIL